MSTEKNRKKYLLRIIALLAAVLTVMAAFRAGMAFGAGGGEPGTQSDPIVTLSYLETRLKDVEAGNTSGASSGRPAGMTKVSLSRGDILKPAAGAMIVVYSGSGTITGGGGLVNISTGELFEDGMTAVLYSLYLAPDGESTITAKGNMSVFLTGGYSLE